MNDSTRTVAFAAAIAALFGCAGQVPDTGSDEVRSLIETRTGASPAAASAEQTGESPVSALLAEPLTRDNAVRIALINNPRLRRAYARLGIAAADVFDASRLANPSLALGALEGDAGGAVMRITAALMQNFADALTLPDRRAIATQRARQAVFEVAADLWNLAQDVGAAQVNAVAAHQRASLRELAARATSLSAALAERYFAAGNINRLELSLAEAAVSQMELDATMARADADAALIRLKQILGLTGDAEVRLPRGLQLPVGSEDELSALHALASAQRLDLQAAEIAATADHETLAMNRRFRYLGNLQGGIEVERESDETLFIGPNLNLELPVFNQGQGRIARADANLAQRRARIDELKLAIEHSISVAHTQVLAARRRVEIFGQRFVPARRDIVKRTREMQNFMIVSPFESLRARTAEYNAYAGYIDALRDYWIARVALAREVGTALPSTPDDSATRLDTEDLAGPASDPAESHEHAPTHHDHAAGEAE